MLTSACHYVTNVPNEQPSLSPAPTPSTSSTPSATPTPSPSISISGSPSMTPTPLLTPRTAALYYVGQTGEGLRLFREFRKIPSSADVGLYSLRFLVAKGQEPLDEDYQNLWGNGSVIHYINYSRQTATVDLSVTRLNLNAEAEQRAIDQLVWTLTANHPTTKFVRFTSGGKQFASFSGFVDATQSFSRQLHYEVLAPVWVNQTRSVMTNPVTITGTACTFEGGVHWVLWRNGETIRDGHVTAAGACPMRGSWFVALGNLRSGNYMFVAEDISAKDGQVVQEDTKEFIIR